ncbi:zinc-dependent metalloprotease [Mycobacterium sp. M1]|uniref:Zinc-dependent metalloprotease n=1 Tax=Mycolicibacter acidiphilus TaxID=2835306 RepID=A0ABS5RGU0_9MYCO|nr:zinc-dependent metalloprotease [Mycolicibacter acidiphilus]MBS9533202.1 zinc-dependent metalloprotease [Mycolicibacter acidiphilus]
MSDLDKTDKPGLDIGGAVDWRFAATVGGWLARPAPPTTDYTRRQACDDLSRCAREAEPLVREVTGLGGGADRAVPEARVVDRQQWIATAAESMRVMTGGPEQSGGSLTGRFTGAQTGALLAFVSSGILGQYDPFADDGGRLLLVYPNVIAVERQLRVEPADFRLWVCLHEVTHRVQFTVNPWLAGHMSSALAVLTEQSGPDFTQVLGGLAEYARARRSGDTSDGHPSGVLGLVRAVQSEAQRTALDQLLTLGTLLEGHADHVMDAVGPVAVPSVATIRQRFDERRNRSQSPLQRLLRALLGIDAKLSQYTRGKAFVDAVVGRVGMERFNAVWSGPETLPLPAEIEEPQRWIDRVL